MLLSKTSSLIEVINLNRNIKLSLVTGAFSIILVAIFFYVLIIFSGPAGLDLFWRGLPGMIAGMIGGSFGAIYALLHPPDERSFQLLKDAARNSWIFMILALPFFTTLLIFNPTLPTTHITSTLFILWIIALTITLGSYALYYNRR